MRSYVAGGFKKKLILQHFNGHYEAKRLFVVDSFAQNLEVFCTSKLNVLFAGYKTLLYIQRYSA
jgi:hypothetical protein